MLHIKAVSDDDLKIEIELTPEKVVTEFATDLVILWDQCKGEEIKDRYDALCASLSHRWDTPVNNGTALVVIEQAIKVVHDLKKTHIS